MALPSLFDHTPRAPWIPGTESVLAPGERVLVTGAGGSIGSALARAIAARAPERLVLLDRAEHPLYELERRLDTRSPAVRLVLGDAGDRRSIDRLLREERPRIVFHAAAHKHAPLLESQPFEACRNNTGATRSLLAAARDAGVERFVLLSTDKAVSPAGIMGVSKWLAEGAVRVAPPSPVAVAVRLGNVWGSRGSVIPRFAAQLAAGEKLTVTDAGASRYFLSEEEAAAAVAASALHGEPGDRLVPEMGAPVSILAVAEAMLREAGESRPGTSIRFTGLRPGDKREERLLAPEERFAASAVAGLRRVEAPPADPALWDAALDAIVDAAERRDGPRLLETVRRLLPGFVPGPALRAALSPDSGVLEVPR